MHSKVEWAWYIPCKIPFGLENGGEGRGLIGFQDFGTFFNLGTSNHGRVVLRTLDPFLTPKAVSKFANVNGNLFFLGAQNFAKKMKLKIKVILQVFNCHK